MGILAGFPSKLPHSGIENEFAQTIYGDTNLLGKNMNKRRSIAV